MRFPKRTLVLMVLAVLAFLWMYAKTRDRAANPPVEVQLEGAGARDR